MPSRPRSATISRNRQDIAIQIKLPPTVDEVHDKWRQQYSAKCPYDSPPKTITKSLVRSAEASDPQQIDVALTHLKGIRLPLAAPRPSSANMTRRPLQPLTSVPTELMPLPTASSDKREETMAELQIRAALIQACRSNNSNSNNNNNNISSGDGKPAKQRVRYVSIFTFFPYSHHHRPGSALETPQAHSVVPPKVTPQAPISVSVKPAIHRLLLERQLFSSAPTDIVTPASLSKPSPASAASTPIAARLSSYGQSSYRTNRHSTFVKPPSPSGNNNITTNRNSLIGAKSPTSPPASEAAYSALESAATPPLEVGTAVEVRYKGKGSWRPGKIFRVKSCDKNSNEPDAIVMYDIEYDEIKRGIERDVPRELIRVAQLDVSNLKNRMLTPGRASVMSKYSFDSFDLSTGDSPTADTGEASESPKPPKFPAARFLMMGLKDARARLKKTETEVKGDLVADMNKEKLDEMHQLKERQEQARLWEDIEYEIQKSELGVKASDITIGQVLGRGKFASVYRGQLSVVISDGNADNATVKGTYMNIDTAVKFLEYSSAPSISELQCSCTNVSDTSGHASKPSSSMLLEVMREVKALKQLRHPNIVMLHGVLLVPRVALVLEFCSAGDLATLLTRHRQREEYVSFHMKLQMLWDAAKGLQYIHSKRYIHRDIKVFVIYYYEMKILNNT